MRDEGEPISSGQQCRGRIQPKTFRSVVLVVGLFCTVWLVNGIVAVLFMALMQELGQWGAEGMPVVEDAVLDASLRLGASDGPPGWSASVPRT